MFFILLILWICELRFDDAFLLLPTFSESRASFFQNTFFFPVAHAHDVRSIELNSAINSRLNARAWPLSLLVRLLNLFLYALFLYCYLYHILEWLLIPLVYGVNKQFNIIPMRCDIIIGF